MLLPIDLFRHLCSGATSRGGGSRHHARQGRSSHRGCQVVTQNAVKPLKSGIFPI